MEEVHLIRLPTASATFEGGSFLAVLPRGSRVPTATAAVPFACRAGRLYLPLDAELWPPVTDEEVVRLLPLEMNVMLPGVGLVGCRNAELLTVSDLVFAPEPRREGWDRAVPGIKVLAHVVSVEPDRLPTAEDVMGESQDDIGSGSPSELPPLPEESGISQLLNNIGQGMLSRLARVAPDPKPPPLPTAPGSRRPIAAGPAPGHESLLRRLSRWAARRAEASRAAIAAARAKELARLARLLETDPDRGLRYALPMTSTGQTRGEAKPGWRLGRRSDDFDLRKVFRSGPTDSWDTGAHYRAVLIERYRELANRELQLGRFRRAAYVLAQLLGDFAAAADALRRGEFYREAATLYREKLKNTRLAAECLEKGGLFAEAIPLYELLVEFERVGDLYRRLGREDAAVRSYNEQVRLLLASGKDTQAAALLEGKLGQPDGALAVLDAGWTKEPAKAECLSEAFQLLHRLGRHSETERRIKSLRDSPVKEDRAAQASEVLSRLSTSYNVPTIAAIASDATRVIAGRELSRDPFNVNLGALLQSITRAAPADRLLSRDTTRYADLAPTRPRENSTPVLFGGSIVFSEARAVRVPKVRSTAQLGHEASWRSLIRVGDLIVAIGVSPDAVQLGRIRVGGSSASPSIIQDTLSFPGCEMRALRGVATLGANTAHLLIVPQLGSRRAKPAYFPPANGMAALDIVAAQSLVEGGPVLAIARDTSGVIWYVRPASLVASIDGMILQSKSPSGQLLSTRHLPMSFPADAASAASAHLMAHGPSLSLTLGRNVHYISTPGAPVKSTELASEIVALTTSGPNTVTRLVATFASGGTVIWPQSGEVANFGVDLDAPVATLASNGMLLAIGPGQGRIYDVANRRSRLLQTFQLPTQHGKPIALAQSGADEYVLLSSTGSITVLQL